LNNLAGLLISKCRSHPVFTVFSVLIIGINSIVPRTIQVINAVTFKPDNDFSIHINGVRELLEPIVGLPLFYLRAGQPIEEYIVLWIWIFISLGIYLIIKKGIRFYKKWLLSIPTILGLTYFILVWMIFWPLPSNKIINESESKILFNTHAHSYFSHDGLITPIEQMEWHNKNGFDAFFLTEHNHNLNTLDFVQRQKSGQLNQDPQVMAGIEFSGSNHMVLLGLTDLLITFGKKDSVVIPEVHKQGGVVGVAHWFDGQNKSIQHYIESGVNGFEIVNKNQLAFPIEIHSDIINACEKNSLFLLGGADYHGYGPTCGTWNVMDIPKWKSLNHDEKTDAILSGLKKGDNQVIFYSDRQVMPFDKIWLSPPINILNHFRGLNIVQILSWIGWGILFISLNIKIKTKYLLQWIPIISGSAIFTKGRILLEKSIPVVQHNDVLLEVGELFTIIGISLIIGGVIVRYLMNLFPANLSN
jgi:hypothetical protein